MNVFRSKVSSHIPACLQLLLVLSFLDEFVSNQSGEQRVGVHVPGSELLEKRFEGGDLGRIL